VNILELVAGISVDSSGMEEDLESLATRAVAKGKLIADAIGTVATKGFDLLKGAISSSVETGKSFDTAISQVAATTGQTVDQIGDLKAAAEEMGATTKFTATEAAEGINILAMAGMSASDILNEDANGATLLSTTLDLASAGAMSMESSATYLTSSLKGFSKEGKSAAYYADLMAKGATLANTDVSALGEALSGVSANASAYGQASDSVTLSLLKLAEANVTGSNATTALNSAMSEVYTPTDQAKKALDSLGVSAYNADGTARDFNDIVDNLTGALSGMTDQQKNATLSTIFGVQGLDAYNKMAAVSAEKTNSFKESLAAASGSAAQQAQTQLDNLEGSMTLLDSAMDGLKLAFYNLFSGKLKAAIDLISESVSILTDGLSQGGLLGVVKSFGKVAENAFTKLLAKLSSITKLPLVSWFKQLKKTASTAFSGVGSAVKELFTVFEPLIEVVQDFLGVTEDSSSAMEKAQGKMSAAKSVVDTLKQGISAAGEIVSKFVSGPLTALAKIFAGHLLNNLKLFSSVATAVFDFIGSLPIMEWIGQLTSAVSGAFSSIINAFMPLMTAFESLKSYLIELVTNFLDSGSAADAFGVAITVLGAIVDGIAAAIQIAGDVIGGVISFLASVIEQIVTDAQTDGTLINSIITGIQSAVETAFAIIADVWQNVLLPVFTGIYTWLSENIGPISTEVFNALGEVVTAVFSVIEAVWNNVLLPVFTALLSSLEDNIKPLFETTFQAAQEAVSVAFQMIADTWENHLKPCWDAIKTFADETLLPCFQAIGDFLRENLKPVFDEVFKAVSESVTTAFDTIVSWWDNVLKPLFDGMLDFVTNIFSGKWSDAWNGIVSTFSTVFAGIIEFAKTPINAVIKLINGAIAGIESALNAVIGAMNKISVTIPDWVPGFGGSNFGINIPTVGFGRIGELEKGGILRKGQKGLLEGKGDEAVVPLEKSEGWLNKLAEKINGNPKPTQVTVVIEGYDKDKKELAEAVAEEVSKQMADDYDRDRRVFA
jgi:TP901 family phage tail tape measure protein